MKSKHLVELEKTSWKWWLAGAGSLGIQDTFAIPALQDWAFEAWKAARLKATEIARIAMQSGWKFVDEQLRTGACMASPSEPP